MPVSKLDAENDHWAHDPYEIEDMQPTQADLTETDRLLLEHGPTKLECPSNDCPLLQLTHSMEGKVYLVTCALGEHFTQDGPCPFPPAKVVAALDDLALEVRSRRALVTQHMNEARRYEELRARARGEEGVAE